jgi:hypothetical protein
MRHVSFNKLHIAGREFEYIQWYAMTEEDISAVVEGIGAWASTIHG